MIELVSADRCISCDRCIEVCPTRVFDRGPGGLPLIARQPDCQTCYLCEAYCPVDALFVAPETAALPHESRAHDEHGLADDGLLGGYRAALGWGKGRTLGARAAVGPPLPHHPPPLVGERPARGPGTSGPAHV